MKLTYEDLDKLPGCSNLLEGLISVALNCGRAVKVTTGNSAYWETVVIPTRLIFESIIGTEPEVWQIECVRVDSGKLVQIPLGDITRWEQFPSTDKGE